MPGAGVNVLANYFFSGLLNYMNIQKTSISFGEKYPTGRILEITTRKIFEPDGVSGYIETLKKVHGNVPKYTGHQGYKRYAEEVSKKILAKYPEIAQATQEILDIAKTHTSPFAKDLKIKVQPVLDRFGKEIDIVI